MPWHNTIAPGQTEECPAGSGATLTIANHSMTQGSCNVIIDNATTNCQIAAGQTRAVPVHNSAFEIDNTGKASLDLTCA